MTGREMYRRALYATWTQVPQSLKKIVRKSSLARKLALLLLDKSVESHESIAGPIYVERELLISIDVVITSYMQSHYIKEALESVLAQSIQVANIFVVEHSGSPVERKSILEQIEMLADSRISFHEINECWPGEARNFGASLGYSELLVFLDADDYISQDYLFNACFYLNFYSIDFIGAWCQNFFEGHYGRRFGDVWKTLRRPTWRNLIDSNAFPVTSLVTRKSFEAAGGWMDFDDKGRRQDEAINLWRRLILSGAKGANLQQIMIFLRRHQRNLSDKNSERPFFDAKNMRNSWAELIQSKKVDTSALESVRVESSLNVKTFHLLMNSADSKTRNMIFLLPDKTFFGAGKVIKWFYSKITESNNIVLINCDIQGLGGDLARELGVPARKILELGSIAEPDSWGLFLRMISEHLRVSKTINFGHPYLNPILHEVSKDNFGAAVYGIMFNTKSANAIWLQENPNSLSKIFVESNLSIDFLRSAGWSDSRICKVAHDAHRFGQSVQLDPRREENLRDIRILWFARMAPEKQPQDFITCANKLKYSQNLQFTIAGTGPLHAKIESMVKKTNANLFLSGETYSNLMGDHDIYISTSSDVEGRPLAVIEALESGMFVYAPNSGSISEIIQDGYQGISIYRSINELCEILMKLEIGKLSRERNSRRSFNQSVSENRLTNELEF